MQKPSPQAAKHNAKWLAIFEGECVETLGCLRFMLEYSLQAHTRIHHALIHLFIHTYIHAFIHLVSQSTIYSSIHAYIHPYIHTFIHTYIHTYIHSFIHICTDAYMRCAHACILTDVCVLMFDSAGLEVGVPRFAISCGDADQGGFSSAFWEAKACGRAI